MGSEIAVPGGKKKAEAELVIWLHRTKAVCTGVKKLQPPGETLLRKLDFVNSGDVSQNRKARRCVVTGHFLLPFQYHDVLLCC